MQPSTIVLNMKRKLVAAARHFLETYGPEYVKAFTRAIDNEYYSKAEEVFKLAVVTRFDTLPEPVLASILQYLTIDELNLLLTTSEKIQDVIMRYKLHERRLYIGQLSTFGTGEHGTLGDDDTSDHNIGTPTLITVGNNKRIVQVSCGYNHTAVITEDDQLYAFGAGQFGKRGDGERAPLSVGRPTLIPIGIDKKVVQVACGYDHTAAITKDGELYMFGDNRYNQLGMGETRDIFSVDIYRQFEEVGETRESVWIPSLIQIGYNNKKVVQVSCGYNHTAVLTEDGQLYTFGRGKFGQLGDSAVITDHTIKTPTLVQIGDNKKVVQISCGTRSTAVVTEDGELYAFGRGWSDGISNHDEVLIERRVGIPTLIPIGKNKKVVQVSCASSRTAAITEDGQLYMFGYVYEIELEDGVYTINNPALIPIPDDKKAVQVSSGYYHAAIITEDDQLYMYGYGQYGILGDGIIAEHYVKTLIPIPIGKNNKVVQVSCGAYHTAVISHQPDNLRPVIASQCLSCDSPIDGHCSTCLTPICYSCFDDHAH